MRIVTAKPVGHTTNFLESQESDLIKYVCVCVYFAVISAIIVMSCLVIAEYILVESPLYIFF